MKQPLLILSPFVWGPPRMQELRSTSALLWALKKAGVRQPLVILSPFVWGPPKMQGLRSTSALFSAPEKQQFDFVQAFAAIEETSLSVQHLTS